jgi:hypothetical protein
MPFLTLQFRRGTASQWSNANPTLAAGEMGIETDTNQFKLGDGSTDWNTLPYGGIQGPPAALSSVVFTSTISLSTLTADSIYFKSSIQFYGGAPGFYASTLNYVSTNAPTAVSFNTATGELGYSDFLQLSSFTSLSTIQTSSLLFATTFDTLASTSKLSVSANTLLFNDAPIVAGALTTLPSTISTADLYTSSFQASTISLYDTTSSNFPVLTLSSAYLLLDGQYMSSIASGGIASIPSTLSSITFAASTIQTSTLSLYNNTDSNFPVMTLSSGYLLLNGEYMSSIASGGSATIPDYLSTIEVYASTLYASTTNTAQIVISTTTSTGRLYADDSDIYFNGLSLTVGNQSSFSTTQIFVSSLYASTIVTPMVLQVQFYTF